MLEVSGNHSRRSPSESVEILAFRLSLGQGQKTQD